MNGKVSTMSSIVDANWLYSRGALPLTHLPENKHHSHKADAIVTCLIITNRYSGRTKERIGVTKGMGEMGFIARWWVLCSIPRRLRRCAVADFVIIASIYRTTDLLSNAHADCSNHRRRKS